MGNAASLSATPSAAFVDCIGLAAALLLLAVPVVASDELDWNTRNGLVQPDGTIHVRPFSIPFSPMVSEEGKKNFFDRELRPLPATLDDINKTRRDIDRQFHEPLLKKLHALFPVNIESKMIGDVQTDVVTPSEGIASGNRFRVLVNLHGGGFQVAARTGGQVESIPIASIGRIRVVTVDYREGPENKFPSASEDVAAVYRELLKTYPAKNIGIYGCSAGAVLTAEALAWFEKYALPMPGAAGMFSGGAILDKVGDSYYVGRALTAHDPIALPLQLTIPSYFENANLRDPLVSPVYNSTSLAKFPPTLLITATRDPQMSPTIYTHTQLVKVGVHAELNVWEGMRHCFFFAPEPPESREAWNVIVGFFDRQLGTGPK